MDAGLELVNAVFARLRATPALMSVVTGVYDRVPENQDGTPNVASPYISLGPVVISDASYDCMDGEEIALQIDAWSWGSGEAYGRAQVMTIAGLVRRALNNAELSLSQNALVTMTHEITRIMRDRDGTTNHAAIQFTGVVEIPETA